MLKFDNLTVRYGTQTVIDRLTFEIPEHRILAITGASGIGKTTLLNVIAGLKAPDGGRLLSSAPHCAYIFQEPRLFPWMTALENVEFPLVFKRVRPKRRRKLAKDMLHRVGLGNRMSHKPKEMSGGQQQRVGIARAFVSEPEIVFADEPTGNLDTKTTIEVMEMIKRMAKEKHQTIVMVTHDQSLASYADKVIHILDGKIQSIEVAEQEEQEENESKEVS